MFTENEMVKVTAYSKGKGFAGVMKRHGFSGHKASHGAHETFRGSGSIGQCATPSRVFKGLRMAGRKGVEKNTVLGLSLIHISEPTRPLYISYAVFCLKKKKKKSNRARNVNQYNLYDRDRLA
eukprot:TRINITY_DN2539_c0_g1_i4.p3 TRINITY_DN2539_c0_g1~~TRINITY_DN2539_c0_g1_i4.p3  ORF type:complete len:123 (+),score=18.48 TRINITY_DN2539_c0_g1_i4:630-998(+)